MDFAQKSLHPLKKSQRLLSQKIDNAQFPLTYSAFLIVLFFPYMCCIVPFLMTMMNKKQLRHQAGFILHFKSLLAKKLSDTTVQLFLKWRCLMGKIANGISTTWPREISCMDVTMY